MAITETITPSGQREEISSKGYLTSATLRDAALIALGYHRYALSDNSPHTLSDVVGGAFYTIHPTARTVVLYFEAFGVRLRCDGGTVDNTTNGTPRTTGSDYVYTQMDLTQIVFANSTAGSPAIVHCEVFE